MTLKHAEESSQYQLHNSSTKRVVRDVHMTEYYCCLQQAFNWQGPC